MTYDTYQVKCESYSEQAGCLQVWVAYQKTPTFRIFWHNLEIHTNHEYSDFFDLKNNAGVFEWQTEKYGLKP